MEDPKRQAWMYLIAGVVAVVAAIYFLSTSSQAGDSFGILDWAILGMGIVAIYRGGRGLLAVRRGGSSSERSTGESGGPKRIARPGSSPSGGDQEPGESEDS